MLDGMFDFMTLNETIEFMETMAVKMPSPTTNKSYPIGLYIETKQYDFYLTKYNIDAA
jgi:hypothetical protein